MSSISAWLAADGTKSTVAWSVGIPAALGGLTLVLRQFDVGGITTWTAIATVVVLLASAVVVTLSLSDHRAREHHRELALSEASEQLSDRDIRARNKQLDPQKPWFVFGHVLDTHNPKQTGALVMDDGPEAVDILAGPGAGKTTDVLVPAVLRHPGPALVSTTKTDLAAPTLEARRHDGPVMIFDPAGEAAEHPALTRDVKVWTPLSEAVTWNRARAIARAMNRGAEGANNQPGGGSGEFFDAQITSLVAILMLYLHTQPGSSLADFVDEYQQLDPAPTGDESQDKVAVAEAWADLRQRIETTRQHHLIAADAGDPAAASIAAELHRALTKFGQTQSAAAAPNTRAGIMGSAEKIVDSMVSAVDVLETPWDDPGALRLDDFISKRHTLYLVCPDESVRPLTNALLEAYISALNRLKRNTRGTLPERYLVVLDEVVHCTPHPSLPKWLGDLARSANIKFLLASQSYADLQEAYGQYGARKIHQNCSGGHIALARNSDEETAKLFTAQAGKVEIWRESSRTRGKSKGSAHEGETQLSSFRKNVGTSESTTETLTERDIATFSNLSQMRVHNGLVILLGSDKARGGTGLLHE